MRNKIKEWIKKSEYRKCFDLISKEMNHRQQVEWAIYSAEEALPLYTGRSKKPLKAIEAAKRCLVENFFPESVKAAAAADAAAAAANSASAVYAAWAAYAAANAADAANAAYAAANAADAAANAAYAAAWAAYAAANAAAWAANNRKEISLKIIEKGLDILTPTSVKFIKNL